MMEADLKVKEYFPDANEMLYTLPGASKLFRTDPNIECALGHRSVSEFLTAVGGKPHTIGWVIHRLNVPEQREDKQDSNLVFKHQNEIKCCLHIPGLNKNEIFGFKYIHAVETGTVDKVSSDILLQLKALETLLTPITATSGHSYEKLEVIFLVFVPTKWAPPKKKDETKETSDNKIQKGIFSEIKDIVEKEVESMKCLDVELIEVSKPKRDEPYDPNERGSMLRLLQKYYNIKRNELNAKLWAIIEAAPKNKMLRLSRKQFFFAKAPQTCISLDGGGLSLFFEKYFSSWKQELITVPNFDRIKSGLLYDTDKDFGRLHTRSCNEYIGEMQNFWKEFVALLNAPVGLLMKKYTHSLLSKVLDTPYDEVFEFDWIFFTNSQLIVFEIGRTTKLENPATTIEKKIIQIFRKLVPKIQFIVWCLLRQCGKNSELSDEEFDQKVEIFLREKVKLMIFFPNINKNTLGQVLPKVWKDFTKSRKVADLAWSHVYFLVQSSSGDKKLPLLLKFKSDITTTEIPEQSLMSMFKFSEDTHQAENSKIQSEFTELASLFALGYFVNGQDQIEEFAKNPLSVDEKFVDDQKKFVKKETESQRMRLEQLKITLSPQQHRILNENRKFLLLTGEPGAGKTVLLLAKAFVSAQDPSVDSILFFAPEVKTALRKNVHHFADYPDYRDLFQRKFKYLTEPELYLLQDKSFSDLHKTVLLIDEIYFEDYEGNETRQKFHELSVKVFAHLKNCWMANIVTTNQSDNFQTLAKCFAVEFFHVEPLTVQYRSSSHIGVFSTNYLHGFKELATSSVRVPGCFMSSEVEIDCKTFETVAEIQFENFDDKLSSTRWAVVFCERSKFEFWEKALKESGKFSQIFITSSAASCETCEFSGGESDSVVVVIDHFPNLPENEIYPVYNLAITRAQSWLSIYVRNHCMPYLRNFMEKKELGKKEKILLDARSQLPIDFSKVCSEKMDNIVDNLLGIAVSNEDKKLMFDLMEHFPGKALSEEVIISSLKGQKSKKFLDNLNKICGDHLKKYLKTTMKEGQNHVTMSPSGSEQTAKLTKVMDIVLHAIDISCKPLLEWIFDLMGNEIMATVVTKYQIVLFSACFKQNTSILEFCVKKLANLGRLSEEMEKIYHIWGQQITILTLLSYCNCDSSSLKMILNRNFPESLLLHKFYGKNALQYAIQHNNKENVEIILSKPKRAALLLSSSETYEGTTAAGYARSLGFESVGVFLDALPNKNTPRTSIQKQKEKPSKNKRALKL